MKTRTTNLFKGCIIAVAMVLSISSCSKDESSETPGTASVTIVNAVEGSVAQDFYESDVKSALAPLSYGASASLTTTAGAKNVTFRNTGTANISATTNVAFDANSSHTLFLTKQTDGSLVITGQQNDQTTPAAGKARVRFVNLATTLTNSLNVATSTGTNLVSALTFRTGSAYQTVDAATALNVNMTGSLEVTTIAGTEIQAGKIYTIWFDNQTTSKVKYHVIVQN